MTSVSFLHAAKHLLESAWGQTVRLLMHFSLVALTCVPVISQTIANPQSAVDNLMRSNLKVDPSTGAMQLQIPLGEYRGRGEASLPVVLNYSSKVWNIKYHSTCNSAEPVTTYRPEYAKGSASGWTSSLGWFLPAEDLTFETYAAGGDPVPPGSPFLFRMARKFVRLPDGSRHEVRRDDIRHEAGENLSGVYYAVDGSRVWYDTVTDTVFMPNGSRILNYANGRVLGNPATQLIDRNGNFLIFDTNSNTWTDTLGRTFGVPIPGTAPAAGDFTYTLPGGVTYTLRWRNLADARTDPTQPLRFPGDAPIADCNLGGAVPGTLFSTQDANNKILKGPLFNEVVLWQISLSNNTNYTFTYNVYGEIDKISYPTGGTEHLTYGIWEPLGGQLDDGTYSQANRGVNSRAVSDGVTPAQVWIYGGNTFEPGVDPATHVRVVTAPNGTVTRTWYYTSTGTQIKYGFDDARTGMEREVRVYNSAGTMLRRTVNQVVRDGPQPNGWQTATRNARVTKTVEIILDTGGNALAATTEITYDTDLNVTSTKRYDHVEISQGTAQTGDHSSIPLGTLIRTEETDYLTSDTNYRARNLLSLPTATRVKNGLGNVVAQTSTTYDEYQEPFPLLPYGLVTGWSDPATPFRGNATTTSSWNNFNGSTFSTFPAGTYLLTHAQYDQCGSVRKVWDAQDTARTNPAQIEYSPTYHHAYPTLNTSPDPDAGGPLTALVTSTEYDLATGLVTATVDANNQRTTFDYDPLLRLEQVVRAATDLPTKNQTTYDYNDVTREITVTSDLNTYDDELLKTVTRYDGLGRTTETRQYEDATNYIAVRQEYDTMGRVFKTSNPFRQIESPIWTTTVFDALGRVLTVTTPDNAVVGTAYSGNKVLVTDQMVKQRVSESDALGRLMNVWEIVPSTPPDPATEDISFPGHSGITKGYRSRYAYDPLDNLITVTQQIGTAGITQTRSFLYDSLKRLTSASNPESGTINYRYDNNSNLIQKTDARGVISNYGYDALNRNVSVIYANDLANTPAITRIYDGAINGKGKLWKSETSGTYASFATIDSYDSLGRPRVQHQKFSEGSPNFTVQRTYDRAGNVLSQTYPSGHVVNYSYDQAGRMISFSGNLGDGEYRSYASSFKYDAASRLQQEQYGTLTPLFHKMHYNIRGQLHDVRLSTHSWDMSEFDGNRGALINYYSNAFTPDGSDNNGNVSRSETHIPGSSFWQQNYIYDHLNRLTSITEKQDGQTALFAQHYVYDRYGNRTINAAATWGGVNNLAFGVNPANNRLTAPGGYNALVYDAAGNLTKDPTSINGEATFVYDAENRLTEVRPPPSEEEIPSWAPTFHYAYDADGSRVHRITGEHTWQVYGMDGELLAEYYAGNTGPAPMLVEPVSILPQKEYGYRSGELLVTATNGDDERIARFITNFYFAALGREPTGTELDSQRSALTQAATQGQTQLLTSARQLGTQMFDLENANGAYNTRQRTDTQFVTDLYFAYLQRAPDSGGLSFWLGWLQQAGNTRIGLRGGFGDSIEFSAIVSTVYGINNGDIFGRVEQYVLKMYYGVPGNSGNLNGDVATVEAAAAESQSQAIQAARTVGINLLQPWVTDTSKTNEQFVTALFGAFLQREASTTELNNWVATTQSQGRNQTLQSFSSLTAVQELAGTLYREILWLIPDHLGTPRMISERSGSLLGIKRHDYLPFGEELFAGTGQRTTLQGYTSDTTRQKFTSKERDLETGLDYFLARYYSSTQGRFTSPDEFTGGPDELYYFVDDAADNPTFYADIRKPQSLNKYQYSYNNPLRWIDPDGHDPEEPEPQDPKLVVPVPVPGPLPPLPLPIQTTTSGPSDQQIIEGLKRIWELPDPYLYPISQTIGTAPDPTMLPVPVPPLAAPLPQPKVQPMPPPPPLTQAKAKDKAKPTTVAPTGPEKAKADRQRKKSDKRTKKERKKDRQKKAKDRTGPNDPHDGEGPHHRRPDPKEIKPRRP